MKNIFKNWMGILTICLCIGAISIGIYSLTAVPATLRGQIGFIPHEFGSAISLEVTGKIAGHSSDGTPEGMPVTPDQAVDLGTATFSSNGVGTLSLSPNGETRYFTDVASIGLAPDDIVVTLSVTNNSDVAVQLQLDTINSSLPIGVTATFEPEVAKLDVSATLDYDITLSCTGTSSSNISAPTTDNLNVSLKVSEWKGLIKSDIIQNTNDAYYVEGEETTYYFIEMGTNPNTGEKLRWVPIAKYDEDTQTYIQHTKNTAITELGTYYFVSEYVLGSTGSSPYLSYNFYNYDNDSELVNIPTVYYNGGTSTDTSGYSTLSVNPNDYSVSNIRAYLNSNSNNPSYRSFSTSVKANYPDVSTIITEGNSFLSYFKISDDPVYEQITPRPLSGAQDGATFSLYSDIGATTTKTEKKFTSTTKTINGINITTTATDIDKFWCLSYYEAYTYLGDNNYLQSPALSSISLDGDDLFSGSGAQWWLRTPKSKNASYIVRDTSYIGYLKTFNCSGGARPAFQMTISLL